jgi:nickel/cobalt transporter (NiCoT) family protein
MLGYLIVAIFIGSWLLSMLFYRLKGYDRIDVVRTAPAQS